MTRIRRQVARIACVAAATVLITGSPITTQSSASETRNLNAARHIVASACRANEGIAWGTDAWSGNYGCVTKSGWISCDHNAICGGSKVDPETAVSRLQKQSYNWGSVVR